MQLLTNHIGYERLGHKSALILADHALSETLADIVDCQTGQSVMQLPVYARGSVDQWHSGDVYQLDFSALDQSGEFCIKVGDTTSPAFSIADGILFDRTFSDVIHYFKSQRCTGTFDQHDRQAPLLGSERRIDVRGGWYDASGDVSKYFSHLSYSNYLNPQQIPMVVWNMLNSLETLNTELVPFSKTRLHDEALFGADFLVRMHDADGYFYLTVFDKWSKDPAQREICAYETQLGNKTDAFQAGFRQGAGVAIAALAAAARLGINGEYDVETYRKTAETGYWHLKENNRAYLDDGQENTIDFYCALLATTELFKLTASQSYLEETRYWASKLAEQQQSDDQVSHFWSANADGSRPYFHAAEAGLPAIALMQYLAIETDAALKAKFEIILVNALNFELQITNEVNNPFGYPRQYIKNVDADKRTSFFIAQRNETGYWWQGENARLGSLAAMAYMATNYVSDSELKKQLRQYGQHALNWIVGLNPYDMCMLDGHGRNNPDYLPELGFINAKGGVCNGITAGFDNEHDIAFKPEGQKDDMLQNWRWGEQWIPHAAWYLLAIAMQKKDLVNG
ncbi:chitobiase [Enterovibrio norvegicus FF-33]|uniref:Chitobiase n=1 Tax=Enterovibrio norvegicus FF-454 TaxID=1185651 RepID=A0A1E5BWK7_9GAMM|nr:glycoside hydrolase family 9 protein [Enterovibrio norvegicus]OEE57638.1 chitobiase [Enterovibrio norvegicus FF-454]OEE69665.1 chitobiase [Enterovibrio norvegicus FF-33]OEE81689.1 chitobiase [Enterovibrio norvegicus FF-162]